MAPDIDTIDFIGLAIFAAGFIRKSATDSVIDTHEQKKSKYIFICMYMYIYVYIIKIWLQISTQ